MVPVDELSVKPLGTELKVPVPVAVPPKVTGIVDWLVHIAEGAYDIVAFGCAVMVTDVLVV